jgi:hypothetical protein
MLFENHLNYLEDEFQIKKMKSYNDAPTVAKRQNGLNLNKSANNFIGEFETNHSKILSVNGNEMEV